MIPEFRFKKRTAFRYKSGKKSVLDIFQNKKVKVAGTVAAGILGVGLVVLAMPGAEKQQSVKNLMTTAGVSSQIQHSEAELDKLTISKNEDKFTFSAFQSSAGFNPDIITGVAGDVDKNVTGEAVAPQAQPQQEIPQQETWKVSYIQP